MNHWMAQILYADRGSDLLPQHGQWHARSHLAASECPWSPCPPARAWIACRCCRSCLQPCRTPGRLRLLWWVTHSHPWSAAPHRGTCAWPQGLTHRCFQEWRHSWSSCSLFLDNPWLLMCHHANAGNRTCCCATPCSFHQRRTWTYLCIQSSHSCAWAD